MSEFCGIVRDLLPLYHDQVCSPESQALVEEHLLNCVECQVELENIAAEFHQPRNFKSAEQGAISSLKHFKAKILRKNVLVAVVSIMLSLVIIGGSIGYVFLHETTIAYEEGLVRVEVGNTTPAMQNGKVELVILNPNTDRITFAETATIDIAASRNTFCRYATSRDIEENGQHIRLVYISFSETISTQWQKGDGASKFTRIVEPQSGDEPIDQYEVYYLDSGFSEAAVMQDLSDFAKLREKAAPVWSGRLE
jgi:hypothetical protein